MQTPPFVSSSSPVIKVILLFLVQGGGRNTLTKKNVCPDFRQRLILHLLILNCLQLKIFIMLKWHIWQWHT